MLDLTQPLAKHGVVVTNRISPALPAVVGDTARIVQILYNLIGNACKFTDKVRHALCTRCGRCVLAGLSPAPMMRHPAQDATLPMT